MNLSDHRLDLRLIQANDRRHAVAFGIGALHQFAAQRHQTHGIVERQRTGNHRGRIGTDGQSGHVIRLAFPRL